jgi:hypothetical protein
MEQKIITAHSASDLNTKLADLMKEGWKPIGSHQVVVSHEQNRFAGMQHKDTIIQHEYSLSVQREHTPSEGQEEVINSYLRELQTIMHTRTDDIADIQNLRAATIRFLDVLKYEEDLIRTKA